jgi:hypothetical protein
VANVGPITGAPLACGYSLRRVLVCGLRLPLASSAQWEPKDSRALSPGASWYKAGHSMGVFKSMPTKEQAEKGMGRCDMRSFQVD